MKKIIIVIGARPQFIKHAPVEIALRRFFNIVTIHTGQHYDENMSEIFFNQLMMSRPSYLLKTGSASHGVQTGKMMIEIDKILEDEKPVALLVYGDTNSTLAGALCAAKLHIPVIHIEAGLRSFNKEMPEEINRVLTDQVSTLLFAPTSQSVVNLANEGIKTGVFLTGDVMSDTVLLASKYLEKNPKFQDYYLVTLHRPYNTDYAERMIRILNILNNLKHEVVFPIHPRTLSYLEKWNINTKDYSNIHFIEPTSYFDLISLQFYSLGIVTDSGGIQKEAYMLKKKCVTIRSETEWIETLKHGWNHLVFENLEDIPQLLSFVPTEYEENIYGKGNAAEEIAAIINKTI